MDISIPLCWVNKRALRFWQQTIKRKKKTKINRCTSSRAAQGAWKFPMLLWLQNLVFFVDKEKRQKLSKNVCVCQGEAAKFYYFILFRSSNTCQPSFFFGKIFFHQSEFLLFTQMMARGMPPEISAATKNSTHPKLNARQNEQNQMPKISRNGR